MTLNGRLFKVILTITIILILSGCLQSHYVAEPSQPTQRVTQQNTPIAIQETPFPNVTTTSTLIISQFYNLTVATLDYNNTSGNTTLLVAFPLNSSSSITCNDTKYYPDTMFTTYNLRNESITGYNFIVVCAPSAKATISIAGYSQIISVPDVGKSWTIRIEE